MNRATRVLQAALALFTALIAMPTVAAAQTMSDSGQRVRVTHGAGKRFTGVLQLVSPQDLTVRDTARQRDRVIPRSDITLVERSLGQHRNFWGSFAVTFAVMTVGVSVISGLAWTPCESTDLFDFHCLFVPASREDAFAFGALGGAVIGVPLGAIIGAIRRTERWLPVAPADGVSDQRPSVFLGTGPARSARVGIRLPVSLPSSAQIR